MVKAPVEIAIIGGTGMYETALLTDVDTVALETRYGAPSDEITVGTFMGRRVAFLPRHGRGHRLPPHLINYRANIAALRTLGVRRIVALSAVGSLREDIAPAEFALSSQFLDFTKTRRGTFATEGDIVHISVADPFCPELSTSVVEAARRQGVKLHRDCTYVCIEGPRFSTRAESRLYRDYGAHVIGMTLVPECQLAREAEICYASVAMVTDYDVWANKPVSVDEIRRVAASNNATMTAMLKLIVEQIPAAAQCACGSALGDARI